MLKLFNGWLVHVNPATASLPPILAHRITNKKCTVNLPSEQWDMEDSLTQERKQRFHPGTSFQFPLLHTSVEADATEHGDWGTLLLREEVNDASSDISWPEEPREHC